MADATQGQGSGGRKVNCWEHMKCGREPSGPHVKDRGLCPAALEKALNGTHGGKNAGRACWVVCGTLCKGQVQGVFAQKFKHCESCEFYKTVRTQEGYQFALSPVLLAKLRSSH